MFGGVNFRNKTVVSAGAKIPIMPVEKVATP
jgi:hypothetical protein